MTLAETDSQFFLTNFNPQTPTRLILIISTMDVAESSSSTVKKDKSPVTIITIGMAGAGKTTFVQRINAYLHSLSPPSPPYILNLDPAVTRVPYEANIDIRDTVNYQEVMKQFVSDPSLLSFPIFGRLDESSPLKGII